MLFVDSCDPIAIQEIFSMGIAQGVTTNPLILAKRRKELGAVDEFELLQNILNAASPTAPVFVQVPAITEESALGLADAYRRECGPRIGIKVPFSEVGLRVARRLIDKGITVNITSLMTSTQAYLGALTGAAYVSLFMGRISDMNNDAVSVIHGARALVDGEPRLRAKIIVGSIRQPRDVMSAIGAGAHIVTASPDILKKLLWNPGTQAVNAEFEAALDEH
jgi:transaldolase